jgi:leucyl-tRNA synthetase
MEYNFREIEEKWRKHWAAQDTYQVLEDASKEKYYVLDMFPYPSGAGLHVGHPLGYIASDIIARYKKHKGFNVLHPMGFDSFGLPAEQYAIQTGQHPAITTEQNIARYREQLERLGFNYDWSREVRTSDPAYYQWTQWIFIQLYNSWYNKTTNKAESIDTLTTSFADNGTYNVDAAIDRDWYKHLDRSKFPFGEHFSGEFTATDWEVLNEEQRGLILQHYRLAYLADTWVNWCEALGTVLANDEVKDGLSERGGHPVEQRLMKQWSLRITAYAERLLGGLDNLEWSESIKEMQRNWIGRSQGAMVRFMLHDYDGYIDVFTTRPDTLFGVSFMTLAPEHELVSRITTPEQQQAVQEYVQQTMLRTERDRQSDVKHISGVFTGAYALHPFTGDKIPVWIGDYVLAGYGTGAVMAVPAGDQRDFLFAKHFNLPIPNIFEGVDVSAQAYAEKTGKLMNSGFLTGLDVARATEEVILELEKKRIGYGRVNYRLRDAIFSRQRYWGEPFPVYYEGDTPRLLSESELPLTLPRVDKYLPTESGEPPLARARREDWPIHHGDRMEYNTMPGWAGSSWYFLRYMDPKNKERLVSPEKVNYWGAVDLYMGGSEHATGHLLYARFWTKFLYDRGVIPFDEPFKKMINQGMILGKSCILLRDTEHADTYVSYDKQEEYIAAFPSGKGKSASDRFQHLRVDVNLAEGDELDRDALRKWQPEFENAIFYPDTGTFRCGHEVEKMSKRWHNVVDPEVLCNQYGADTMRMYEMFLGPVEQSKPWDTKGISGVHNFLRKLWRLAHDKDGNLSVNEAQPSREELQILHRTIKRVTDDLERLSWNTVVSALMIAVNELTALNSSNRTVLEGLSILLSPYAPHFAEELWEKLGHKVSVTVQPWPVYDAQYLEDSNFEYPVSFNGKTRFKISLPADMLPVDVERAVLDTAEAARYLEGKTPKKVVVVQKRIVNVVV